MKDGAFLFLIQRFKPAQRQLESCEIESVSRWGEVRLEYACVAFIGRDVGFTYSGAYGQRVAVDVDVDRLDRARCRWSEISGLR